jgi:hypothetical protein
MFFKGFNLQTDHPVNGHTFAYKDTLQCIRPPTANKNWR